MVKLICPYCGGAFQLDDERNLQKQWICPYCGNKSQMTRQDGVIKLVGMFTSTPETTADETQDKHEADDVKPVLPLIPRTGTTRPLAEMIAEAEEPGTREPDKVPAANNQSDQPEKKPEKPIAADVRPFKMEEDKYEKIVKKAKEAADANNLPLFSIYSRKALFMRPEDPRMYACQAIMREKANAFSNGTWASPSWPYLTPKQKQQLLAQKLYALNTAFKLGKRRENEQLQQTIAAEIVRQAVDFCTEQAEIRRRKMLFIRKFKGKFRRADLKMAREWLSALALITKDTCPHASSELKQAVIEELNRTQPHMAKKLKRRIRKLASGD